MFISYTRISATVTALTFVVYNHSLQPYESGKEELVGEMIRWSGSSVV